MTRVKSIARRRHKKIKLLTRGFKQSRRTRIKAGKEALMHAGQYAYVGRKLRKRDLRSLWIIRLNAASRKEGLNYNTFISLLKSANVEVDRKILSDIAISDPQSFKEIITQIK